MFERWGLQLPELTNSLDPNVIIRQSGNIVKDHFKFEHPYDQVPKAEKAKPMSDNIIQLNENLIKHVLKNLVRSSVELQLM